MVRRMTHRHAAQVGGNILGTYLAPRRGDREPPARVHQLPHVTRPIEGHQGGFRARHEQLRLHAQFLAGHAQVVPQQFWNVFPAFAQRRNFDADDVQTVQQVFAKMTRLDPRLQILMGGGDDAYVDLHRRLSAHTIKFTFGQNAQQPGLQGRRHVADFVEK